MSSERDGDGDGDEECARNVSIVSTLSVMRVASALRELSELMLRCGGRQDESCYE